MFQPGSSPLQIGICTAGVNSHSVFVEKQLTRWATISVSAPCSRNGGDEVIPVSLPSHSRRPNRWQRHDDALYGNLRSRHLAHGSWPLAVRLGRRDETLSLVLYDYKRGLVC
jgi:hypothetical protein